MRKPIIHFVNSFTLLFGISNISMGIGMKISEPLQPYILSSIWLQLLFSFLLTSVVVFLYAVLTFVQESKDNSKLIYIPNLQSPSVIIDHNEFEKHLPPNKLVKVLLKLSDGYREDFIREAESQGLLS